MNLKRNASVVFIAVLFAGIVIGCTTKPAAKSSAQAEVAPSADLIAAANREGTVVIYSVTTAVGGLLDEFKQLYPGITPVIKGWDTTPLYEAMYEEAKGIPHDPDKSGTPVMGDVIWSSGMDLQFKLVAEGYAQPYDSPEARSLPAWAKYQNLAWATTYEPIGFVYNKKLTNEADVPRTRAALIQMISQNPAKYNDKITAFDPELSGLGYLLLAQDLRNNPQFWDVAKALKSTNIFAGSGSGAQFQRIQDGKSLLGYDLLCSYVAQQSKNPALNRPDIAYVLPEDYTLICSRVLYIAKSAPHPNAAKLWVDYMLSKRGQEQLCAQNLGSVRDDITDDFTAAAISKKLGNAAKPIPVSQILADDLQDAKRNDFLGKWKTAASR
ncbi:ABC transporter substrate-binding protein [Spirochaetia bacterium]|nr:ABC transporter substrate-binding protein [Spirochaetia bacterium]